MTTPTTPATILQRDRLRLRYVQPPHRTLHDTDGDGDVDLEERYAWNGQNVALDFVDSDGDGGTYSDELTNRYLWGQAVDQLLAQEAVDDGGVEDVLYPVRDNLGSTRSLVEYDGDIASTYSYDSYGNVTVLVGNISDTRYLFTCQEYDSSTGLYYYDARWYDPTLGKFISEDPISFFGGDTNLYRYVGNNSLNYTDSRDGAKITVSAHCFTTASKAAFPAAHIFTPTRPQYR